MLVYVAGRVSEIDRVRRVQQIVKDAGDHITFDWTQFETGVNDGTMSPQEARGIARMEFLGVQRCDLLILCWQDQGERSMLGALLETGMALGMGATVWVLDCDRRSVFWELPAVKLLAESELEEALRV